MFVGGHQSGGRGSTSNITPTIERGPIQGGNKDSRATCWEVRTLCKQGRFKEALHVLDLMDQQDLRGFSDTYACFLQQCINRKALAEGKHAHALIVKSGFRPNVFLRNNLINMYAKCGSLVEAREVFDKMPKRNVVSWSAMIAAYTQHGHGQAALKLFQQMQQESVEPNQVTFVWAIKACASIAALEQGKQIHAHIIESGFESDVIVGSALVNMYAKCGNIHHARLVFDGMPERDVVLWTAMIAGYADHGDGELALKYFQKMQQESIVPNKVTLVCALKACACIAAIEQGKQIHDHIIKSGFESDIFVGSALVDMYSKCGSMHQARQVFDKMPARNVVSWTAIIAGYAHHGDGKEALKLFHRMQQGDVKPNKVTFASALRACICLGALEQGKQIHFYIRQSGFESDVFLGNTLIDMYAKCRSIEHARQVFDRMSLRNVVSWNSMITGYVQHGQAEQALELFHQMQQGSLKPDKITFTIMLNTCTHLTALEQGKQIHGHLMESGFESDVIVGNALIDMYAKCGSIEHARQVFDRMPERNVGSWNAMIVGYTHHGNGKEVLQLVQQMQWEGMKMNHITFTAVLSACSHAGLVDEARQYFDSMSRDHKITPT